MPQRSAPGLITNEDVLGAVDEELAQRMSPWGSMNHNQLAAGADRLGCRCGEADCPAGGKAASATVIHVIAEAATVAGTGHSPGAMPGHEGLIPAELIAELAASARLRPLIHGTIALSDDHGEWAVENGL